MGAIAVVVAGIAHRVTEPQQRRQAICVPQFLAGPAGVQVDAAGRVAAGVVAGRADQNVIDAIAIDVGQRR
ncbi:MAG: hypothetical protein IPK26_25620 [Planctomycetes bacterium]|nr:hypothetical protein [Planctomycetota bacterium]